MREQIEILKNRLAVNPLDANVQEKEEEPPNIDPVAEQRNCLMHEKQSFSSHQPVVDVVYIDPLKLLMQEIEDDKTWIEEYMKANKSKKKINKKQLNKDIFEIDFMCD